MVQGTVRVSESNSLLGHFVEMWRLVSRLGIEAGQISEPQVVGVDNYDVWQLLSEQRCCIREQHCQSRKAHRRQNVVHGKAPKKTNGAEWFGSQSSRGTQDLSGRRRGGRRSDLFFPFDECTHSSFPGTAKRVRQAAQTGPRETGLEHVLQLTYLQYIKSVSPLCTAVSSWRVTRRGWGRAIDSEGIVWLDLELSVIL